MTGQHKQKATCTSVFRVRHIMRMYIPSIITLKAWDLRVPQLSMCTSISPAKRMVYWINVQCVHVTNDVCVCQLSSHSEIHHCLIIVSLCSVIVMYLHAKQQGSWTYSTAIQSMVVLFLDLSSFFKFLLEGSWESGVHSASQLLVAPLQIGEHLSPLSTLLIPFWFLPTSYWLPPTVVQLLSACSQGWQSVYWTS